MEGPTRYGRWVQRTVQQPLGFGAEFWSSVHEHPSHRALVALAKQSGGDEKMANYFATRGLITDVIHAAGAIEHSVGRIEALMSEVQRESDEIVAKLGIADLASEPRWGFGTTRLALVAWEWGNPLAWTRGLEDRVKRRDLRYRGADLGLLPSMNPAHPATAEVQGLWERYEQTNVPEDVRNQAALNLHAASIFGVGQPAHLDDDGTVIVTVPDPVLSGVGTREELTFKKGRDIRVASKRILDEVERFVDELLDVFERWQRHG